MTYFKQIFCTSTFLCVCCRLLILFDITFFSRLLVHTLNLTLLCIILFTNCLHCHLSLFIFFFSSFFSFLTIGNQAKLGLMGNYIVEILTAHFLNEKIITAIAKTVSVLAHGNISNRSESRIFVLFFCHFWFFLHFSNSILLLFVYYFYLIIVNQMFYHT